MRPVGAFLVALAGLVGGGCKVSGVCLSGHSLHSCYPSGYCPEVYSDIGPAAYAAVDTIVKQCDVDPDLGRLLVATVVDINNVERTSMFGRQFSEMAATRLTQHKVDVIHATVRQDHLRVDESGQFLLSRKVQNLAADYNAKCVLVGTYGVVDESVFVSVKLVSTVDDATLAAADVEIHGDELVMRMIDSGFPW